MNRHDAQIVNRLIDEVEKRHDRQIQINAASTQNKINDNTSHWVRRYKNMSADLIKLAQLVVRDSKNKSKNAKAPHLGADTSEIAHHLLNKYCAQNKPANGDSHR